MSKYCKQMGLFVTYLDCMECEDKTCLVEEKKTKDVHTAESSMMSVNAASVHVSDNVKLQKEARRKKDMKRITFPVSVGDNAFLVYKSRREGHKENVVLKIKVNEIRMYEDRTVFCCCPIACMTKQLPKEIELFCSFFCFEGSMINTGCSNRFRHLYPVFTTKEKCLEWLRGK